MGYSRKRFRRRRGGSFLVIAATALLVVLASHPAIHYETASFAHMIVFMFTVISGAAIAGMAWAITTNSMQNHRKPANLWQKVDRAQPAPREVHGWTPHPDQIVEAEVVPDDRPHWVTPH